MAQQNYGPTPPRLLRFPDGSDLPTAPDGGTFKTLDSETASVVVFSDALTHDLSVVDVMQDRCVQMDVFVEAYDPAGGGRLASGSARLQVARLGAAAPTIVGTPVMMTYTPLGAPWAPPALPFTPPGVEADLVVVGNTVVVRVMGLAVTPIRWRAIVKTIGAQMQQVS